MVIRILVILSFITSSYACDFSTIKKVNNDYLYSKECHLYVGKLIKEKENREKQLQHLEKAIKLKDLALSTADERIMLWRSESYKQIDMLRKYQKYSWVQNYAYFAGGMALSFLSVWAAGQL